MANAQWVNASSDVLSDDQLLVISYLDISTSVLSIIGAGSVVFMVLLRGNVTKAEIHPIFHLSLADFLASIFLVVSAVFFSQDDVPVFCHISSMFASTFFVSTFLLTITYAVQVLMNLRVQRLTHYSFHQISTPSLDDEDLNYQSRQEPRRSARKITVPLLYFLSWGLPLLVCLMLLIRSVVDGSLGRKRGRQCSSCLPLFHYRQDDCWALNEHDSPTARLVLRLGFLIPLTAVLIGNSCIYAFLYHSYRATKRSEGVVSGRQHHRLRVIRNRALSFQGVFFVCWMPSLVLGLISLSPYFNMVAFYPMYIIQAMTAPLQGFLNSMVYAWQRKSFVTGMAVQAVPPPTNDDVNDRRSYFTFDARS